MNTRAVIITIIVSFILVVIGPLTLIAQTFPLNQAVQQGKVEVEIVGLGGSTGDTIVLNVQRKVPERLRLTLTLGTVFKSVSGNVQNMIGTRIKGERVGPTSYRPGSEIYLYNDAKRAYIVEAYCLDFHKPNPGTNDSFLLSQSEDRIKNIIIAGQRKAYSTRVIQSAIWIDRAKVTSSQLQSRFPVSDNDIVAARHLLAELQESRSSVDKKSKELKEGQWKEVSDVTFKGKLYYSSPLKGQFLNGKIKYDEGQDVKITATGSLIRKDGATLKSFNNIPVLLKQEEYNFFQFDIVHWRVLLHTELKGMRTVNVIKVLTRQ